MGAEVTACCIEILKSSAPVTLVVDLDVLHTPATHKRRKQDKQRPSAMLSYIGSSQIVLVPSV